MALFFNESVFDYARTQKQELRRRKQEVEKRMDALTLQILHYLHTQLECNEHYDTMPFFYRIPQKT